jgi:hypothetical protein
MTDAAGIAGALAGIKAAIDLTKTLVDVRDAAKLASARLELLTILVDAQEAQLVLISEKRDLAERVRELEAWEREKERYQPQKIGTMDSICYGLISPAETPDADLKLCAHCFQDGLKRYLQPHLIPEGRAQVLMCRECGDQILTRGVADTRVIGAPRRAPPQADTWGRGR